MVCSKTYSKHFFFLINYFIHQRCIKLIKSDSKSIYINISNNKKTLHHKTDHNKCLESKISILERFLKDHDAF